MIADGSAFAIVDITENNWMSEAQTVLVQSCEQKATAVIWETKWPCKDCPLWSCIAEKMTDCHRLRQSNSSPSSNILPNEQIILDSVIWVPIPLWNQCQYVAIQISHQCQYGTGANLGLQCLDPVPALDIQFWHWTSSSSTGCPVLELCTSNY